VQIYLVGGAVRDQLLSLPVKDRDFVVVGATPAEMIQQGYQQVGKDFPVFLHPQTKQEYALARTERKIGAGYTGFTCYAAADVTLEEDLLRRDLTINALVQDSDGSIIDPLNARRDLDARVLRHISNSFTEDPLRVLRVARFAARFHALGFVIADETLALMLSMTQRGDLAELTPERVWQEVEKTLAAANPEVFFKILKQIGALGVIFPELDALFGIPSRKEGLPEIDTGRHSLMALAQAAQLSSDLAVRFAALTHGLGKTQAPAAQWQSHPSYGQLGLPVIKQLAQRCKVPNECRDLALLVSAHHTDIHNALELKPSAIIKLFDNTDAWRKPARFNQLLLACEAAMKDYAGFDLQSYPQASYLTALLEAACSVAIQPIISAGFRGAEIKQELTRQRVMTLTELKLQRTK
jgi:tRNA nucleotidyltransferase (CCA-adding enzyme)